MEERPRVNYVIIEVRERDKPAGYALDAGMIRHVVHEFVKERGIDSTDMIIRHDQTQNFYGGDNHWSEVRMIMEDIKSVFTAYKRRKYGRGGRGTPA